MYGKATSVAIIIGLYVAIFAALNTIHFQLLPVRVVLYDALLDAALAGVATYLLINFRIEARLGSTRVETLLSLVIGLLLAVLYSLSVPTIIDRSLSVYILEKLAQRGGAIKRDAMDDVLRTEFFSEHRLVDIRLTEQLNSGTIRIENGCIRLTDRGRSIVAFTRFYRTELLPKRREIMGKLTDDLTDPFRQSSKSADYTCKD